MDLIESAQVVVPCDELDPTLQYFTKRLGFRVEAIFPADSPAVAVIAAHGVRLRLQRGAPGGPGTLRVLSRDPALEAHGEQVHVLPNGTRIELVPANPKLVLPTLVPALVVSRMSEGAAWKVGRAGMRYRDLIPDRQGGRFIASHIAIPDGGPVPDYVHFHKVRFQMIYCRRGWVRLVYEDQGEPFVLQAGDCVLQPPEIRHRVLECSPGVEVIEIGSPAEHETHADPTLALPTGKHLPARDFSGQRFVRHQAHAATFEPWRFEGYVCRDTGIAAATGGLAGAWAVRPQGPGALSVTLARHAGELLFLFVLDGNVTLQAEGRDAEILAAGDSVAIPAGLGHALIAPSSDLELLEVTLPG